MKFNENSIKFDEIKSYEFKSNFTKNQSNLTKNQCTDRQTENLSKVKIINKNSENYEFSEEIIFFFYKFFQDLNFF